jgi:lipopolysaccharide export system protein LptC
LADILDVRVNMVRPAANFRGKAFDAARQNSRRVRLLKFAVPFLALVGIAGFAFYALFDPFHYRGPVITVGTPTIKGNKIVMDLPHMTGFNKKQQAYDVTAASATQTITAPGQIDLNDLQAVITMADKSKATLSATRGKFNSTAELLDLDTNVTVRSTKGYSVDLSVAAIDFKAGTVKSDQPVVIYLANGTIRGGSLSITSGGGTIILNDGVVSRFQRPAAKGVDAPAPAPDTTQ